MIHLDTSFLIRALTRGSPEDRRLRAWLQEATSVGISAVSDEPGDGTELLAQEALLRATGSLRR